MVQIAPSLLAADFLDLNKAVHIVNSYADLYHLDVMDGIFVPNISFGFPVIEALAAKAQKPLDIHLMITDPGKYALKMAGIPHTGMVSFHLEACPQPAGLLSDLRRAGVQAGLAVNPDFPLEKVYPFLEYCDFVLIMSVFAGFGGQKFIEGTFDRVAKLKAEINARKLKTRIEVDGGVGLSNSSELIRCGADILVAGTAVFKAENPGEVISSLREGNRNV